MNCATLSALGGLQISDWIDPDSAEEAVAKSSAVAFGEEMGWATHLSLQAVLLHPKSAACVNLARLTNQILQGLHHMQVRALLAAL